MNCILKIWMFSSSSCQKGRRQPPALGTCLTYYWSSCTFLRTSAFQIPKHLFKFSRWFSKSSGCKGLYRPSSWQLFWFQVFLMQRWGPKTKHCKSPAIAWIPMHQIWHAHGIVCFSFVCAWFHHTSTNLLDKYLRSSACVPPACLRVLAMRSDLGCSKHVASFQKVSEYKTAPDSCWHDSPNPHPAPMQKKHQLLDARCRCFQLAEEEIRRIFCWSQVIQKFRWTRETGGTNIASWARDKVAKWARVVFVSDRISCPFFCQWYDQSTLQFIQLKAWFLSLTVYACGYGDCDYLYGCAHLCFCLCFLLPCKSCDWGCKFWHNWSMHGSWIQNQYQWLLIFGHMYTFCSHKRWDAAPRLDFLPQLP